MQTRHSITRSLLIALCLSSTPAILQHTATAAADSPPPTATAAIGQNECRGMDPKLAHERADLEFREAHFRRAGWCYLIAGDKPKADRAFLKATAAEGPAVRRQLAANAKQVRDQFRQFREAFASH